VYQWRFNNANVSGATTSSYTVSIAQVANEGAYTVVLTNTSGSVTSAIATLSLYREFGSAPAPYPSLLASNGARHLIVPGFQLGATNVASTEARTNSTSEDGVSFTGALQIGKPASVQVVASAPGYLNAWIDYLTNGLWSDPLDQVFTNVALVAGTNTITFAVPASAVVTPGTWARFRFSTATNLSFTGEAPNGEVEDYQLAISSASNPPPVIGNSGFNSGGGFVLSGQASPNQTCILEAATNLIIPIAWSPVATNTADNTGAYLLMDTQATNYLQRFYRVTTH
jgi:hypothetical protein